MADARRDENRVTTMLGVNKNSATVGINAKINPATGKLLTTELSNPARVIVLGTRVLRDDNRVPVACGVSTDDDNVIIPLPVSPEGYLLIE